MTPYQRNSVLVLYGWLVLAVVTMFTPWSWAMIFGLLSLIGVQISSPALRAGRDRSTAYYQHLFFISRTIWTWVFIGSVTSALAGYIVYTKADNSIYDRVLQEMQNGVAYDHAMLSQALMDYISMNFAIMIIAGALCFVPMTAYLVYRVGHGVKRARQLLAPARPLRWF